MRKIGVLTSGGDAPGMNACVRAVVRTVLAEGLEAASIQHGYRGMIEGSVVPLDRRSVANIIQRGGTILGTSRSTEFRTPEGRARAREKLEEHGIDGLVLIGGEGTFKGGSALMEEGGPPCVGVPGTIDNDVGGTDQSLGFDTAVNTALEAVDRIRDTAASHELLHFIEVMGRHCGALALAAAVAGGAEAVLVPELPTDVEKLCRRIAEDMAQGKRAVIVVVAEGDETGGAQRAGQEVGRRLGLENRVTVLGHIQRGGIPTAADRILGSRLGAAAVDALLRGSGGVVAGQVRGEVVLTTFEETWMGDRPLDPMLLELIQRLA
jgi:6-phosphofructokinase 1